MERYGVYNLQYNVRMVLERRIRWPAHVACVGWMGDPHRVLVKTLKERAILEGLHVGCVVLN
jgi:hypothetical protein